MDIVFFLSGLTDRVILLKCFIDLYVPYSVHSILPHFNANGWHLLPSINGSDLDLFHTDVNPE